MRKSILFALGCSVLAACDGETTSTDADIATGDGPQSILLDHKKDRTTLVDKKPVEVVVNSSKNGMTLTAFGRTFTFDETDFKVKDGQAYESVYKKEFDNGTVILFAAFANTWEEAYERKHGYSYVVPYYAEFEDEDTDEFFYGVFGDETSANDMPTSGSVTYTGMAHGKSGYSGSSDWDNLENYAADFTLTSNFGTSKIHGSFYLYDENSPVNIDETSITGNSFTTTLSVDTSTCTDCRTITNSRLDGSFFGPNAEEVGGSYSATSRTADGKVYVDQGNFAAAK